MYNNVILVSDEATYILRAIITQQYYNNNNSNEDNNNITRQGISLLLQRWTYSQTSSGAAPCIKAVRHISKTPKDVIQAERR